MAKVEIPLYMRVGDGEEFEVGSLELDQPDILQRGGQVSSIDVVPALRELADVIERGGN